MEFQNKKASIALVITAGGSGSRFLEPVPKQLKVIGDVPLFIFVCAFFSLKFPELKEKIISVPKGELNTYSSLLKVHNLDSEFRCVEGGQSRQDSVQNAISEIRDSEYVLIHDAARPVLSTDMVDRIIEKMYLTKSAVIPVITVSDTVKIIESDQVVKTLDRDKLKRVQTPQAFPVCLLKEAYTALKDSNFTDESQLFEALNWPVYVVDGDVKNIKITYPEDWGLVLYYLGL